MLIGIDVSKWQQDQNWHKARSAGARFAFVRAGSISVSGICYTDYQFERNSKIAPDYMPVGFYWFFRPQHDPIEQANYFCNLIRDKRWKLPPVLDLEHPGDPKLTPAKITNAAAAFIRQVFHRLSVWPLLYSRALWLTENTISDPIWALVDLWVARYKVLTGPWSDGACIPRDFKDWKFWQFSARNNGRGYEFGAKSRSIDINFFNGDQAAFNAYIEDKPSNLVKVTAPLAVSLRSGPEGPAIGATWRGAEWPIVERSQDGKYYKVEGWLPADKVEEV
jgi:GH25 family lysozyme M1 (1,4-beta-N-acetylmuramidase)